MEFFKLYDPSMYSMQSLVDCTIQHQQGSNAVCQSCYVVICNNYLATGQELSVAMTIRTWRQLVESQCLKAFAWSH